MGSSENVTYCESKEHARLFTIHQNVGKVCPRAGEDLDLTPKPPTGMTPQPLYSESMADH